MSTVVFTFRAAHDHPKSRCRGQEGAFCHGYGFPLPPFHVPLMAKKEKIICSNVTTDRKDFMVRVVTFKDELQASKKCTFWKAVYKIVQGKSKREELCEGKISENALTINEDNLVGIAWVMRNNQQLSDGISSDLLARLTAMPFWLDQGGRFDLPNGVTLNHRGESQQIAWLVGGYFIGEAFVTNQNRSDIVFNGIDHTGLILNLESKHRLMRWLDQRQRFGFTRLDSRMIEALLTLAALAPEETNLKKLANMVLYLALFEMQQSYWRGHLLSTKVDQVSAKNFKDLLWLLNGKGRGSSFTGPAIVLALCLEQGLQLPEIFLGSGFLINPYEQVEQLGSFGVSKTSPFTVPGRATPDDCLYWMGQDGLYSSLRCYITVGKEYKLWGRHPKWQTNGLIQKMLSEVSMREALKLERLLESFDGEKGTREWFSHSEESHAMATETTNSPGRMSLNECDSVWSGWRLFLPGSTGGDISIKQALGMNGLCLEVQPKVTQYRSTAFVINNPDVILSLVLGTEEVSADFNLVFDRLYTDDDHWMVGQRGDARIAIYSHRPARWGELRDTDESRDGSVKTTPSIRILTSLNLWICHAEEARDEETFENFVQRIINSDLHVKEQYEDDFRRCLTERRCLESGPSRLLSCLRGDCPVKRHVKHSKLASAFVDSEANSADRPMHFPSDWVRWLAVAEELSRPLAKLEVKWLMEGTALHFGSDMDLKVWENSEEVDLTVERELIKTKRGPGHVELKKADGSQKMLMDFDKISFRVEPIFS